MRHAFMGLTSNVPDDWNDESTVTFTIPPIDVDGKLLSPGNLVINWADAPGVNARAYLGQLETQLSQAFDNFEILEKDEEVPGLPFVRFKFDAGRDLVQILYVRSIGDRAVIVTGTAIAEHFETYRKSFDDVARSIKASTP